MICKMISFSDCPSAPCWWASSINSWYSASTAVSGFSGFGTSMAMMASMHRCAACWKPPDNFSTAAMGAATRNAHGSGARTASVLGSTSQPMRMNRNTAGNAAHNGQPPRNAGHNASATIAAFARVLPRMIAPSSSAGRSSRRSTRPPRSGARSASCFARHLPSANNDDSASAKKKLAPAHTSTPAPISHVVTPIRASIPKANEMSKGLWPEVGSKVAASGIRLTQIVNLPYRRMAFGRGRKVHSTTGLGGRLRIENPRYSRVQLCVTCDRHFRSHLWPEGDYSDSNRFHESSLWSGFLPALDLWRVWMSKAALGKT